MCEQCKEFNDKKYPDMGDSAATMTHDAFQSYGISADKKLGLRLFQERDVTYMSLDGVITRHEIECVYIPWDKVLDTIEDMGVLYSRGAPDMVKTLDWLRVRGERDEDNGE